MENYEYIEVGVVFIVLIILFFIFISICIKKNNNNNSDKQNHKKLQKVVEMNHKGKNIKLCNKKTVKCEAPCFSFPCCVSNMLELLKDINIIFDNKIWISHESLENYKNYGGINPNDNEFTISTMLNVSEDIKEKILSMNYFIEFYNEKIIEICYSNFNKLKLKIYYNCDSEKMKLIDFHYIKINIPENIKTNIINIKADSLTLFQNNENNNYDIFSCFVINQKGRNDRLYHIIQQCGKYNLNVERIESIDGENLIIDNLIKTGIFKYVSNYPMTKNTIACAMSHIKVLEKISNLETDKPCIIFEDDCILLNNFDEVMKNLKNDRRKLEWDIIFLGCRLANEKDEFIKTNISYLYRSGLVLGAYAYMVTSKSAKKILKNIYPIMYPIDTTITIQDPVFDSKRVHDKRFLNILNKYVIYTENKFDNKRFGIVNELSTFVWKESTSS